MRFSEYITKIPLVLFI